MHTVCLDQGRPQTFRDLYHVRQYGVWLFETVFLEAVVFQYIHD